MNPSSLLGGIMKKLLYCMLCLFLTSCATTATSENKTQSEAHYKVGLAFMKENKFQDAFVEFQKSIQANPDNKNALNALGLIHLKFEDYDKAEQSFLDALDVDENFSDAYHNLGAVYSSRKKWDKAIPQFERALKNPLYESPERTYYNLGNAYYRIKKYRVALKQYESALKRSPQFYPAYYGIALCYNVIELYGEAAKALSDGIMIDSDIKGKREKAADVFNARMVLTIDDDQRKDYRDLIEILNY